MSFQQAQDLPTKVRAAYEVSSRLIASLINEGFLKASPCKCPILELSHGASGIRVYGIAGHEQQELWVGTSRSHGSGARLWYPADFVFPVWIRDESSGWCKAHHPRQIAIRAREMSLLGAAEIEGDWEVIVKQLDSAFSDMVTWLQWGESRLIPTIESPTIAWEQAVVVGHPVNPIGRSILAHHGAEYLEPSEATSLLHPGISLIAIDRSKTKITGPLCSILNKLLCELQLPPTQQNELTIPCLSRQLPAIQGFFPTARVLRSDAFFASAQTSLRTVQMPDHFGLDYHIKFALSYTIGSNLRTITPHTVGMSQELSNVIADAVADDTWICQEVAGVTGSQKDAKAARHLSCMLRQNLEPRAKALGQTLIVVSALRQVPAHQSECIAALVFDLKTPDSKLAWFKQFSSKLLHAVLIPALRSGIGLEAHGQNSLIRVDIATRAIVGFCFRDFGSCKIHMPTLNRRGHYLDTMKPGCWIPADREEEAWDQLQHTVFNEQLQSMIGQLKLDPTTAWTLVRDQLDDFFASNMEFEAASRMHAYFTRPMVSYKALLRLGFNLNATEDIFVEVPNALHFEVVNCTGLDAARKIQLE
ncbi:uncharacterized protein RHO25_005647 [Cercospora beticola]|uniref:Aerobactin siderophore biosynthesis IucA/IucC N-terminal domain-containing protein n=2 Tax=Cercospora beticola TaxID=122368 RepID=A0ABZ0NNA6_CERBT|nr:hypothetical protein RHO25_005647 [Cercospora beticola]